MSEIKAYYPVEIEEFLKKIRGLVAALEETSNKEKLLTKINRHTKKLELYLCEFNNFKSKELLSILSLSKSLTDIYAYSEYANSNKQNFPKLGLALSGGGIRSATFNLGVLQALNGTNLFPKVDYLSTVSGGGYTGSSLTYNLQGDKSNQEPQDKFPFERGTRIVRWIRRNASYLTPQDGLNNWALFAAILRGIFINLIIIVPALIVIMLILNESFLGSSGSQIVKTSGIIVIIAFVFMFILRVLLKRNEDDYYQVLNPKKHSDAVFSSIKVCFLTVLLLFLCVPILSYLLKVFSVDLKDQGNVLIISSFLILLYVLVFLIVILIERALLFNKKSPGPEDHHKNSAIPWGRIKEGFLTWLPVIFIIYIIHSFLLDNWGNKHGYYFLFLVGCAIGIRKLLANIYYALLSLSATNTSRNRYYSIKYGDYLLWSVLFISVGSIPLIHETYIGGGKHESLLIVISVFSIIFTALGWLLSSKSSSPKQYVFSLLRIGIPLLLVSVVFWLYMIIQSFTISDLYFKVFTGDVAQITLKFSLALFVFLLWGTLVLMTDINQISMHRYYRNRLVEAFFQKIKSDKKYFGENEQNENYRELEFNQIKVDKTGAPYPIINTNIVTIGSEDSKYANRLGDSFSFTPKYYGSKSTGWETTKDTEYKIGTLGTAMAVSGAAVDPNIGETKSWPLRILMGLLNARLGYWMISPRYAKESQNWGWLKKKRRKSWLRLIYNEMLGFPNETWRYIRLSDGGHFENLGLYELVRRKCKVIIVSDAGADPDWLFSDLSRAIQRIRVDFDADIEMDLTNVKPDKHTRISWRPYVKGEIQYADGSKGALIFIKTTLFGHGLPEDVWGYARKNDKFPDEPTTNQFFTEDQFEAYRILGYHAGKEMIDSEIHVINDKLRA